MCQKCYDESMAFIKWLNAEANATITSERAYYAVGLYACYVSQKNHPEEEL